MRLLQGSLALLDKTIQWAATEREHGPEFDPDAEMDERHEFYEFGLQSSHGYYFGCSRDFKNARRLFSPTNNLATRSGVTRTSNVAHIRLSGMPVRIM